MRKRMKNLVREVLTLIEGINPMPKKVGFGQRHYIKRNPIRHRSDSKRSRTAKNISPKRRNITAS